MKRVCHVISGYYRNDPRIFQRQCKSLKNAGFDVCILTNDNQDDELLDDIPVYSCGNYWTSRMRILMYAKKQFFERAIKINADIYQMHSPELLSLGLALKKAGKIVMYDAHEDLPMHILEKDWLPNIFRKGLSIIVEHYMNRVLNKYDEIISPHSHVVDKLKVTNTNTALITNFAKVIPAPETSKEEYLSRNRIICYTGTVYLHSNQLEILDAISDINDITYNIAGHIDTEYLKVLSKHIAFNKINYIGRIEWYDLAQFYKQALLGIVVIDYKMNLGHKRGTYAVNKIFEYMEAALPIICTDYDLWRDIIDKYHCGICVEPGNVSQIKDAIKFLLDNPDKAYEMGQNGRKAIIQEYNWATQSSIYINIYNKYLN